ncbi:MAG: rhomboid family intramembrane serine protease [Muribaculum sp.]|nr:rhomboid family intramembrane serine protease [Muribaculum sp.]
MASTIDFSRFFPRRDAPLWWIIGISIAVWLCSAIWDAAVSANGLVAFTSPVIAWLEMPSSPGEFFRKWWTAFTYCMVHQSFVHLLVNMLWLWWFWMRLDVYSSMRKLLLYACGVLSGAVFFFAVCRIYDSSYAVLCGASAGVLAVMGATAVALPRRRIHFVFSSDVRLLWVTIAAIALTLLGGGITLAFYAHLGGLAGGIIFALASQHSLAPRVIQYKNPSGLKKVSNPKRVNPFSAKPDGEVRSGYADLCRKISDAARLDELLDKIRISGYDSLSSSEREELERISQNLK